MRETVEEKAARYLLERRVRVLGKRRGSVFAEVQGDAAAPYEVRFWHGIWRCSCAARGHCCHIAALMFVCPAEAFGAA